MSKKKEENIKFDSLVIEGVEYQTILTDKYKARKPYQEEDLSVVTSFISGTIADVFVKENKKVEKGAPLLALEAMKMRNQILAPMNGVVKKIHVKTEDKVVKGQLLIELE